MWKFLIGLLVGIVITILGSVIFFLAVGKIFSKKQPTIEGDSALVLSLSGEIPEAAPVELPLPFLESEQSPTVRDFWTALRQAAVDNRIRALVLEPEGVSAGWGKLEEIRHEITEFKKSGKPVYAFLQNAGSHEYYLASIADKVYISPTDMLGVKGFEVQSLYFKNTLDKLGVQVQVDHIGKYKDYGDMFTKTSMTPETREVLNSVVDQIYGDFCSTVAQGRHKTADQVRTLVDAGPFLADQAKNDGLVDSLGYEDELYSDLQRKTGVQELKKVSMRNYFRAVPDKGDRIAVLVGEGDIVPDDPNQGVNNQQVISSTSFIKQIREVKNDSSVKGVILRVDSPGGDAVASDEILHELKRLNAAKPLVVSMSDLAASGGYMISMTGSTIFAYPDTITGSIGVLYVRPSIRGLYDKLGITTDSIARGKMADIDNISDPLSDAEQEKLHESIASTYRSFLTTVAGARRKSIDQVDAVGQGRVWMGNQAREIGLVDNLGGLDEAIAFIRIKSGLPATGDTSLVMYPPRRSLIDILTNSSSDVFSEALVEKRVRTQIPGLPSFRVLRGGLMARMAFTLAVH